MREERRGSGSGSGVEKGSSLQQNGWMDKRMNIRVGALAETPLLGSKISPLPCNPVLLYNSDTRKTNRQTVVKI